MMLVDVYNTPQSFYPFLNWKELNSTGTHPPSIPVTVSPGNFVLLADATGVMYLLQDQTELESIRYQKEYQAMKSRIGDLSLAYEEDYDESFGALTPTTYAIKNIETLLDKIFQIMGKEFYKGATTTTFEGGIRVEWMRPNASVRLVIPSNSDGHEYIYFEDSDNYGTEPVSPENLSKRLTWLKQVTDNG